jgi:PqqD family protein of HPr-rel-A system
LVISGTGYPDTRWRRSAADDLVWFDCGDGFVVYHRPSGKTHLLNEASYRLMTELLQVPRDLHSIAREFAPESRENFDTEYLEQLQSMLRRLAQLGLIERA